MAELYVKPLSYWLEQIEQLDDPDKVKKLDGMISHEIMRRQLQTLKLDELYQLHTKCRSRCAQLTLDTEKLIQEILYDI
jgi:hypothetical protein